MGSGSMSLIVPTYGVAAYLPPFLDSLDAQEAGWHDVEVVFVDDGSPDESATIIAAWIEQQPDFRARLVRKANGGLASARNAGLDVATGDWVTFPDPDDVLSPAYLRVMSAFIDSAEAGRVHLVTGRPVILDEATGLDLDDHPLRHRFERGTRVVDLVREPLRFHVAANTGLFRREVIEQHALRFDGAIRPVWEDGHFTVRYLSAFARPKVAMMADAVYHYRRRADSTSLMDGQWTDPDKFVTVPRRGWLDALEKAAAARGGHAPPWAQNMVIYDVRGYFKCERVPSPTGTLPREVTDEFLAVLHEVMHHIDLDVLDRFRGTYIPLEVRQVLRMHFLHAGNRPSEIAVDRLDTGRRLARLHYFYDGAAPVEGFRSGGEAVAPVHAKTRPCTFFGRVLGYERVVWLPATRSLSATLDGAAVALRVGPLEIRRLDLAAHRIREGLGNTGDKARPAPPRPGLRPRLGRVKRDLQGRLDRLTDEDERRRAAAQRTLRLSRTPIHKHRYRDAWLLADRPDRAGDNAEELCRWLIANRPAVNAWFVLERTSRDWDRLAAEGVRLVEHGSREHDIALLNARHVLSSRLPNEIASPREAGLAELPVERAHFTYLQHGVTKDDTAILLEGEPIDLMITAATDEYRAIVDDASRYLLGEHEVALTGFPRHDRLLELSRGPDGRDPKLVLVMPTWRRWLADAPPAALHESDYATAWRTLLATDQLRRAADEHGGRVVFVAHPAMDAFVDTASLPAGVEVRAFGDVDVQLLLAQASVLVTDYSSIAFDMAYLERPVVYFQFDRREFESGEHTYRRGTWNHDDDGFGPVTLEPVAAAEAVGEILRRGPEAVYAQRSAGAFPFRDGGCSRRVHDAVVAMTVPLADDELYRRLEPADVLKGRPVADELRG